jgi:hypothetical protein
VVRNIKRKELDMEVMIKAMIEEVSIGQDLKPTANESIEHLANMDMVIPDWIVSLK